jgi:hypothetical protein
LLEFQLRIPIAGRWRNLRMPCATAQSQYD